MGAARVPFLAHSCFKAPNALLGETIAHFFQSGFRLTIAAQKCIWKSPPHYLGLMLGVPLMPRQKLLQGHCNEAEPRNRIR